MKRLLLWLICVAALLGGAVDAQITRSIVPREAGEAGIGTAGKPWGAGYFWALYLGEDSVEFPFVEVIAYGPRIDALEAADFLTEETDPRLPAHSTSGNLLQSDGTAWTSWTPDYITDYTVTEADVTTHEAALTITESQISDLVHYTSTDWATDFAAEDTDGLSEGTTHLYHTDARAVDAIKADEAWNATNWDTAFGWGDHETEGYLTEEADPRLPAHSTSGNLLQSDGTAWTSWTPDYITGVEWGEIGGDQSDILLSGFNNDLSHESPLTFTAPLNRDNDMIDIPQADETTDGYLSSTDWATFDGKQPAGNYADGTIYQHDGTNATITATVGVLPDRVKSASATSVGDYGAAFGYDNTAGIYAAAFGYGNTAGNFAAAFGFINTAGSYAAAFGYDTTAGNYGFAAGRHGKGANGSFVFSDSQTVDFVRTAHADSFSVRAQGGTYFDTPDAYFEGEVDATVLKQDGITLDSLYLSDLAGLDTDDLSEGAANLYFTDARAVEAFEGVSFRFVDGTAADLVDAVDNAVEGQTIVVPAGTYELTANLVHDTAADIVVPGAAGGARAVLTDGAGSFKFEIGTSCTIEGLDVTGLTPANFQFTFTDNATPTGTLRYCDAGNYSIGHLDGNTNNFSIVGSTFGAGFCSGGTNEGTISNSEFGADFCSYGTNEGTISNSEFGADFCGYGTNEGTISNSEFGWAFCGYGGTNNGDISNSTFGGAFCGYNGTNNATARDSTFADTAATITALAGTGEYANCIDSNGVLFSTADALYGNVSADEVDATVLKQDGVAVEALSLPSFTDMDLDADKSWQPSVSGDMLRVAVVDPANGDYTLTISDPDPVTTPMRVSVQFTQPVASNHQVVLAGNIETQGGVALADPLSTVDGASDTFLFQWDGVAWILERIVFDHE